MGDAPVLVRVVQRVQEVADAVESRALLVVGLDDRPRRVGGVGMEEHRLLGGGVVVPLVQRLDVDGRQLPVLERIVAARDEAPQLFLAAHREPVLEQQDAAVGEHALQLRRLAHELQVLQRRTEAHDPLDAGAVVPGAVEEDHLAGGGQMLDVALEIPLALLLGGRFLQGYDPRAARVQVFHEALDGAALAGGVAAFEQDHHALAGLLHPALHLEQFDLQVVLGLLVLVAAHPRVIGIVRRQARRGAVLAAAVGRTGDLQGHRLLADVGREEGYADLARQGFQLLDRGGTVDVGGNHHHRLLLAFLKEARQLARGGGLARALQAGHQDHRRRRDAQRQVLVGRPHQFLEFGADDLHERLSRGQALRDLGADGALLDLVDEVLDHRQGHVGLEQGHAHFAQSVLDVVLGQLGLAGDMAKRLREAVCKVFEHARSFHGGCGKRRIITKSASRDTR